MTNPKIALLVEKDLVTLKSVLQTIHCDVFQSYDPADCLRRIRGKMIDLLVLENSARTFELVQLIRKEEVSFPIIMVARSSTEEQAIAALRLGINDYFKMPVIPEEFLVSIRRLLQRTMGALNPPSCSSSQVNNSTTSTVVGQSLAIVELKEYIERVALTDSNVLVTGETGTGKELIAQAIYLNGPRHRNPFICVNCAAIPDTLLESELFGYERGAFTGATAAKQGKLTLANNGTLFLDEIGDMTLYAQAKILRAVESKEVQRLGATKNLPVNVRVIAATNQDLEQLVAEKSYRSDLYYRLNVARIHVPALRDRREDIPLLLHHYVDIFNDRFGTCAKCFTDDVLEQLLSYQWPGNVRELKNLVEATLIVSTSRQVSFLDLPVHFRRRLQGSKEINERDVLLSALFSVNWNKSRAAEKLKWSRMTLYRKMEKYRVSPERGRAENLSI